MEKEIKLNPLRYFELLQKQETLKSQNISLVYENPKEHRELLAYQIIVEGDIYYKNKPQYIQLIENYLSQNLGEDETRLFVSKFVTIFRSDNQRLYSIEKEIITEGIQKLDALNIHPNSVEFSDLTFQIIEGGELLTFDSNNSCGITVSDFINLIQKNYLLMKNL
jgi:hypothetical protein